ncbi:MAG: ABC transporter permease subunit, partial [Streptosporangiaceae bacterium]
SHLMSEMENTADHLIVIGRGKLIADCSMTDFITRSSGLTVLVRTPQPDALARALTAAGGNVLPAGAAATTGTAGAAGELQVRGLTADRIGDIAFAEGVRLHHLAPAKASLEQAFMELTGDSVKYRAGVPAHAASIAACAGTAAHWSQQPAFAHVGFDATQTSVLGLALLGQLVIVVLGTLAISSEYSTGMIRTSLTVMPRRGMLYGAKAAVFGAVALVIVFVTSFAAFFVGQALLSSTHQATTLSSPNALRAVIVTALFVGLCGLFAYGLGAILRHTAGAMTTAYGLLFLVPQLAKALPNTWYADSVRWLPGGDALNVLTATVRGQHYPHLFSAWGELAVFAGYTVILLAVGAALFRKRDA